MSALRGRPRLAVLPVVVLVALAFVLGSVGTASAAALTKGAVKKIAAKVVAKQAPNLSVKHAATAGAALTASNADKVGGQTAAQLGVRPIVFTLPKSQVNPSSKSWTMSGVPAGTYLMSLHLIFHSGGATAITFGECQVKNETADDYPLSVNQVASPSRVPVLNGTGYAAVAAGDLLRLSCNANAEWTASYDAHLALTPVASATQGTLTSP